MNRVILSASILVSGYWLSGCSNTQMIEDVYGNTVEVSCQPVYGNWCGKGYPAYETTGFKPEPVDQWDAACKRHDLCYDKYGEKSKDHCDRNFSNELESIYNSGVPVPHQIVNAYNVFKEHKSYRFVNVSFEDLWDAKTVSCDGTEGIPALFCDVNMGKMNCEVSMGLRMEGARCFCDYPAMQTPMGFFPGRRLFGNMKTANEF